VNHQRVVHGARQDGTRVMKAFLVTESEILDPSVLAAYIPRVREALKAAGGRPP
jgi:hypothetical protein